MILPKNYFAYILFSLCPLAAISLYAAPHMVCDAPKYDFGSVIGRDEITREFTLWNRGDSPLEISSIKNCCGVESTIVPMEILPGSNAVCTSVFTTRNRYGEQDKQILIASNDRKHPYYELKMVGTLLRPVECSPRYIRLGNLFPDSVIALTITATNLLNEPVVLESVQSTVPGIRAEVVPLACRAEMVEDLSAEAGRSSTVPSLQQEIQRNWEIKLSTTDKLKAGRLNGQIQLNFSSGTVSVPVIGTVKPIIQVVPEQIQFASRSTNKTERLVMLRSGDGRPFEVLSAKLVDTEGQVELFKLADDRWQCKLFIVPIRIRPDAALRLKTSCQSALEIDIPIEL